MIRSAAQNWAGAAFFAFALGTIALPLGPMAVAMVVFIIAAAWVLGQILGRYLGLDSPFLGFVLGFTAVAYGLTGAMRLFALHPLWIAGVLVVSMLALIAGELRRPSPHRQDTVWISLMLGIFTLFWNLDVAPRLAAFDQTGQLNFWVDIFVHAARLSELGGPFAAGRGNALMADSPAPLYHMVSYAPSALAMAVSDALPLTSAVLIWIPMGVLVMAAGVVALGQALGGRALALWIVPVLALVPALDGIPLHNGLFSFPWLLEAAPGTFYSLGLSATALALLLHWLRDRRGRLLMAALLATMAVFLVRANFFLWLAPLVVIVAFCRPDRRFLRFLTPRLARRLGLMGLVALLVLLSWTRLSDKPELFLLSYLKSAHADNGPNAYGWLFADLTSKKGQALALILSLPLMVLAIGNIWLLMLLFFRGLRRRHSALQPWDSIPGILTTIACIFAFLGPMPANGDLSEFRHRPVPLLLTVFLVWGVHFAILVLGPKCAALPQSLRKGLFTTVAVLALLSLPWTVTVAKAPRMDWGHSFYGLQFSPDLTLATAALHAWANHSSSIAFAGQSAEARVNDPAVIMVAQSGVPAFLSCPQSILLRRDRFGDEARRRMAILSQLDNAPDLPTLYGLMATHGITDYVVTSTEFVHFDPNRLGARAKFGQVAIYSRPAG
jgi:hypothetical protein